MAVAPLVAGWDRRMPRALPGPLPAASTTQGADGTAFLPDELAGARLVVRAAFGADPTTPPGSWTYTDITGDVMQDNGRTVSMRVARQDWKTISQPARLTLALDNRSGDYTAHSALARRWPYLVQGVPIQVQLWIGGQYWDRFDGEVDGWDPSWDTTGNYAITVVTAYGTLNRIGGGTAQPPPLRSALYRAITSVATPPVAYWPMEDGTAATQAVSALPGGAPMSVTTGTVSFGATGPDGGGGAVDFSAGGTMAATIPSTGFVDRTRLEFAIKFPTIAAGKVCEALSFSFAGTGNIDNVQFIGAPRGEGALQYILSYNDGVTAAGLVFTAGNINDNKWHWVQLDLVKSGTSVIGTLRLDGTTIDTSTYTSTTLGAPSSLLIDEAPQPDSIYPTVSNMAVWYTLPASTITSQAATGHTGETVSARLARLCGQENIPFTAAGGWADSTAMGPQRVDTLIRLLRECEATGSGFLYDGPGAPGLTYQPLAARYNAPALLTLDASAGELLPPFNAKDDAFERVNSSTVTNRDGSTATYVDTTSQLGTTRAPTYAGTPPVQPNYATSSPLANRAAWEVRQGTIDSFRYPQVTINLRKIPTKVPAWLQTMPGSPLTINPPYAGTHPPGDLLEVVEGWQEDLARYVWTVTPFCSRGAPYQVGTYGTARVDTAGSTIAADAAAGAGSLSVASASTVWSTTAGDYPNDFWINGIRVTVTAVAGATSPQTFTVTGSTVTKPLQAGDTVRLWSPAYPALAT